MCHFRKLFVVLSKQEVGLNVSESIRNENGFFVIFLFVKVMRSRHILSNKRLFTKTIRSLFRFLLVLQKCLWRGIMLRNNECFSNCIVCGELTIIMRSSLVTLKTAQHKSKKYDTFYMCFVETFKVSKRQRQAVLLPKELFLPIIGRPRQLTGPVIRLLNILTMSGERCWESAWLGHRITKTQKPANIFYGSRAEKRIQIYFRNTL